jgi:hypothetical protein
MSTIDLGNSETVSPSSTVTSVAQRDLATFLKLGFTAVPSGSPVTLE